MSTLERKSARKNYNIVNEKIDNNIKLSSFFFKQGGNIYVFSYKREDTIKHTLIDTGDFYYRNQILSILIENEVNPVNIELIILTHRHTDHSGLAALLSKKSNAKILVHANFKNFIEGHISYEDRRWLRNFDLSKLKECDIEYLPQHSDGKIQNIGGVDFISLTKPIMIGETGKMEIFTPPESTLTHTPDQILVLYSPINFSINIEKSLDGFLPTDNILFSGDLWLMTGPIYYSGIKHIYRRLRYYYFRMKNILSGKRMFRLSPREQDVEAKDALKKGFTLIRVKPGHGKEFIGSRIIPDGILANRDILIKLGYIENAHKSVLKQRDLISKIDAIKKEAYGRFVEEIHIWLRLGYSLSDVSALLVRIYKEQIGGSRQVSKDRKERRTQLKKTLVRLMNDKNESDELNQIAESTLLSFKKLGIKNSTIK